MNTQPKFGRADDPQWKGGRIEVRREEGGWGITHLPEAGGEYPCGWDRYQGHAEAKAELRARHFGARLFVERSVAAA